MNALIINYQDLLPILARHCNLKNSVSYNRIMAEHYECLYNSFRKRWGFRKALFAWIRMQYYLKQLEHCRLQHLLNDVNKKQDVIITIQ